MRSSPTFRARSPFWRSNRVCALAFGFFALLEVSFVTDPGRGGVALRVLAGAVCLLCCWLTWRALGCATVLADEQRLTVRTLLRTRSWVWPQVLDVSTATGPVGMLALTRMLLVVSLVDGRRVRLIEMNASTRSPAQLAELTQIAQHLHDLALRSRSSRGALEAPK